MGRRLLTFLCVLALALAPVLAEESREERLGRVSFPNSGAPEAQEAFLGGLAALHSFFYDEAADLFREAQQADPGFALAYWGEAMTHNHPLWHQVDVAAARAVLESLAPTPAERAARAGTDKERAFLATLDFLYGKGSKEDRDRAYSEALGRLYERYPDDLEVAAFYALSLQGLQRPGQIDPRLQIRSAAILEELFDANPLHPGVAHYLIHAYDDPIHAPLGLRPARIYADIAPAAPHALHMPAHIFVQLGMWDRAAASNEDAYAASVDWVRRRGHPLEKRDFHSLSWLQYAYLQLGRVEDAAGTLDEARQVAAAEPTRRMTGVVTGMLARQLVETGRGTGESPEEGRAPEAASSLLFARGLVAARGEQLDAARAAVEALATRAGDGEGYTRSGMLIREKELAGLVALAEGDPAVALARLAEAVELEEELGTPSGPPFPEKPAVELYGETLLELGRPAEAAEQFAHSLLRTPNRAASLLGSARAAAALGDEAAARRHYRQLLAIWHDADPDLPALAEVRQGAGAETGAEPAR